MDVVSGNVVDEQENVLLVMVIGKIFFWLRCVWQPKCKLSDVSAGGTAMIG